MAHTKMSNTLSDNKKTWLGEFLRIVEGTKVGYVEWQSHLSAYAFAAELALDKVVLDIGCGTGYGSAYLTKKSEEVVAGDVSREASRYWSSWKRNSPNGRPINFVCLDAHALPFTDATFDAVVALEVIEHLENYEHFLLECKRVMKNDGVLILSTPNKAISSLFNRPLWPTHSREFSIEELKGLLRKRWRYVYIYGQEFLDRKAKLIRKLRIFVAYLIRRTLDKNIISDCAIAALCKLLYRKYGMVRFELERVDENLRPDFRVEPVKEKMTLRIVIIASNIRMKL